MSTSRFFLTAFLELANQASSAFVHAQMDTLSFSKQAILYKQPFVCLSMVLCIYLFVFLSICLVICLFVYFQYFSFDELPCLEELNDKNSKETKHRWRCSNCWLIGNENATHLERNKLQLHMHSTEYSLNIFGSKIISNTCLWCLPSVMVTSGHTGLRKDRQTDGQSQARYLMIHQKTDRQVTF